MHSLRLLWAAHNDYVWERRRRREESRRMLENVDDMPEELFIENFRLTKSLFRALSFDLAETGLKGSYELPVDIKILCALSFFATGSYQRIVGITQHVTQRTASRCIRQVVDALNRPDIQKKWIRFPMSPQERVSVKAEFQRRFQIPGVVGCIDCTHISIVKPSEEEQLYHNRKGFHSLNVQMICDQNLKILSVNPKFGGATHDSHIWSASQMEQYMRNLHEHGEHVWLLGDAGYPQRPWLMTPILNAAPGSREELYTARHMQARNCIERTFGVLKSRWRCLLKDRTLHYHPTVARKITLACCVLHNMAVNARLPEPSVIDDDEEHDDTLITPPYNTSNVDNQADLIRGRAMLSHLVSRM